MMLAMPGHPPQRAALTGHRPTPGQEKLYDTARGVGAMRQTAMKAG
jgi:hypothetical protein